MTTRRRPHPLATAVCVPIALALGACTASSGTVLPAADEQPAVDPAPEEVPLPPARPYKGTASDTCADWVPGTYC
jgi:hypothetical protein